MAVKAVWVNSTSAADVAEAQAQRAAERAARAEAARQRAQERSSTGGTGGPIGPSGPGAPSGPVRPGRPSGPGGPGAPSGPTPGGSSPSEEHLLVVHMLIRRHKSKRGSRNFRSEEENILTNIYESEQNENYVLNTTEFVVEPVFNYLAFDYFSNGLSGVELPTPYSEMGSYYENTIYDQEPDFNYGIKNSR